MKCLFPAALCWVLAVPSVGEVVQVSNTAELVRAIDGGEEGTEVRIAPGTYELAAPLEPKTGMKLIGSGIRDTVITHQPAWKPSREFIPDSEVNLKRLDTQAYLIRIRDRATDVAISHLTLRGPQMHGAIFGSGNERLHLHHLLIEDTLYCGVRTFSSKNARIHDCEFVDAGGRWKRGGLAGTDGGISGGAIFVTWMSDSEVSHNRIRRTKEGGEHNKFGIKGRGGKRLRIHHNTIEVNFAIEFPFDGADGFEIDHNILQGVVSIPKYAGGNVPESGVTFDIHHNYFTTSYAIEFVRNGVAIHHNLFDFSTENDGGNLISGFGRAAAPGPATFHNNLVSNPGRGVIWINDPYDNLTVRNNHIIARPTATPRLSGLFGLNRTSDFATIRFLDNLIECHTTSRPLFRNEESYGAEMRNNRLIQVSDADRLNNPATGDPVGPEHPLHFRCGVHGERFVDGWEVSPAVPIP